MPIYEYQCRSCGHSFDLKQGFDADPIAECPQCQSEAARQFRAPAVIYKGSGFYTTDYKRKESFDGSSSNGHSSDKSKSESTTTSSTSTTD